MSICMRFWWMDRFWIKNEEGTFLLDGLFQDWHCAVVSSRQAI